MWGPSPNAGDGVVLRDTQLQFLVKLLCFESCCMQVQLLHAKSSAGN